MASTSTEGHYVVEAAQLSSSNNGVSRLPVDEEIAQGLGEEAIPQFASINQEGDTSSKYNGFIPSRDKNRVHSILPSSAFFAPKRPPPVSSISRERAPNLSSEQVINEDSLLSKRGEPVPLDKNGRERGTMMRGRDASVDAASSLVMGSRSSSDNDLGLARSSTGLPHTLLDKTAVEGYRQGDLKSQVSRDLLLEKPKSIAEQSRIEPAIKDTIPKQDQQHNNNRRRRYNSHQGSNRFYLFGLIMTSDDNPLPFILSLVIMVALPVLWFIFVAPFTWHHISPAPVIIFAYIWAISASSMCVTAWRDPGVLPRELDPDPPCTAGEDGKSLTISDRLAIPLPRVIRLRNGTDLKVKWCDTCGIYRPPRSSHCRVCDNCVENIDHHCTFLNTCIGRRNYFSFFAFLLTAILACFFSISFCILHIYYLTTPQDQLLPRGGYGQGKNFGQALKATPLSAVIFLLSIAVVIPVMTLFGYHIRLVCMNRTTVEQIRINTTSSYSEKPSYDDDNNDTLSLQRGKSCFSIGIPGRDPNPFAYRTIIRNVKVALLRPMTAQSWIDRYHYESSS